MFALMQKLRERQRSGKEFGAADMIAALTLTPIILALFFAIVDVSLWLNTKSHIESVTRDSVRLAAMWGGTDAKSVRLNTTGKSSATHIRDRIYNDSKKSCLRSNCTKAPVVSCSVASGNGKFATAAGQTITCNVTYYYKSIFPGSKLLGFGQITEAPIKYGMTAVSETGYR